MSPTAAASSTFETPGGTGETTLAQGEAVPSALDHTRGPAAESRRGPTLYCELTDAERAVCDQLRATFGFTSDANLVRTALWAWVEDQGLRVDGDLFALRVHNAPPSQTRQSRSRPTVPQGKPIGAGRVEFKRGATASHPWRGVKP